MSELNLLEQRTRKILTKCYSCQCPSRLVKIYVVVVISLSLDQPQYTCLACEQLFAPCVQERPSYGFSLHYRLPLWNPNVGYFPNAHLSCLSRTRWQHLTTAYVDGSPTIKMLENKKPAVMRACKNDKSRALCGFFVLSEYFFPFESR